MKLFLLLISVLFLGFSPNISNASLQSSIITIDPQNITFSSPPARTVNELICGYCTSYTYSPWGACQSNSLQSRTLVSALPEGCSPTTNLELTKSCPFCVNCAVAGICQTGGGCNQTNGKCIPVVNVPAGQDPNEQCGPLFNACSGNNRIGPDGTCDGAGACRLSGLSEACLIAGPNQIGGGCLDGACLAVDTRIPKCGDGVCEGLENCSTCSSDCGLCTFCGDGIVQKPNSSGLGGIRAGYEECDGSDGITSNPLLSSFNRQYGCVDPNPSDHSSKKVCVFKTTGESGGYCGDDYCQTKYENSGNCASDCTERDYYWQYSAWEECNLECGGGTQTRIASCVSRLGNIVNESYCQYEKDITIRECNTDACADGPVTQQPTTYSWQYLDDWSPCTVLCGGGSQDRFPSCVSNWDEIVEDSNCDISLRLIQTRSCNTEACADGPVTQQPTTYSWQYLDDWSPCTVLCGGGSQDRLPSCVSNWGEIAEDSNCNINTRLIQTQSCNTNTCDDEIIKQPVVTYSWEYSEWSPICYPGTLIQRRTASCVSSLGEVVADDNCTDPMEATRKDCPQLIN